MKKLIIRLAQLTTVILGAIILFGNNSTKSLDKNQDFDVNSIIKVNKADAECFWDDTSTMYGHCTPYEVCIYYSGQSISCTHSD